MKKNINSYHNIIKNILTKKLSIILYYILFNK